MAGKENREIKNSVFVDLFYEDESAEANEIALFNAIHDEPLPEGTKIRRFRVDNTIYMNFQNDISLYEPSGTDREGYELVYQDVINSETPDFAEQLHLAIESEKMLHAVQERLSKREQIVVIFRYGLWGQEELTQQEIAGRLGISRSYVYRHIYCK